MSSHMSKPAELTWSSVELELLQAAREDQMPSVLQQRVHAAVEAQLGLHTPATHATHVGSGSDATSGASAPSASAGSLGTKVALWGTLCVVAVGATTYFASRSPAVPRTSRTALVAAPPEGAARALQSSSAESSSAAGRQDVVVSPAPPSAAEGLPAKQPVSAAASGKPAQRSRSADSKRAAAADQLRVEAQLLESARAALAHADLPRAAQWLARYHAQFASGVLVPESEVLRVELYMRRGELESARAQAAHFLTAYPDHPLRDRVRALSAGP